MAQESQSTPARGVRNSGSWQVPRYVSLLSQTMLNMPLVKLTNGFGRDANGDLAQPVWLDVVYGSLVEGRPYGYGDRPAILCKFLLGVYPL